MRTIPLLLAQLIGLAVLASCGDGGSAGGASGNTGSIPTPIQIVTASLPAGQVGVSYDQTIAVTGGQGSNHTWSFVSGSLPTGLVLGGALMNRVIGIPTAFGNYAFTLQVDDNNGNTDTQSFSVTIIPANLVSISTLSLPQATNGINYSQVVATTGGTGSNYRWSITTGALPPGINLVPGTPDATLSGTPTQFGIFHFTLEVLDPIGTTDSRTFNLTVPQYNGDALPNNRRQLHGAVERHRRYPALRMAHYSGRNPIGALAFARDADGHPFGGPPRKRLVYLHHRSNRFVNGFNYDAIQYDCQHWHVVRSNDDD